MRRMYDNSRQYVKLNWSDLKKEDNSAYEIKDHRNYLIYVDAYPNPESIHINFPEATALMFDASLFEPSFNAFTEMMSYSNGEPDMLPYIMGEVQSACYLRFTYIEQFNAFYIMTATTN